MFGRSKLGLHMRGLRRLLCGNPGAPSAMRPLNGAAGVILASVAWLSAAEAGTKGVAYRVEITTNRAPLKWPLVVSDLPGGRAPLVPALLRLAIDPAPAAVPDIVWSASGGAEIKRNLGPNYLGQVAPPDATYVTRGSASGPFTITAHVGPPVNRSVTVPAFGYPLISVGCAFGKFDGIAFDRYGQPQSASRPEDADIYVTGPDERHSGLFIGCSGAFISEAAEFTLHVPGGAIALSTSSTLLPMATASDLRPPLLTSFDASRPPSVLLLRTRDGRLAKIGAAGGTGDGIAGPTLVANANGAFADATFARAARIVRAGLPELKIAADPIPGEHRVRR